MRKETGVFTRHNAARRMGGAKRYPSWSERWRWVSRSAQPILRSVARRANHLGNLSPPCPAPFVKIFRFAADPNQQYIAHRPVPQRALAIVTNAGRDAVD